MGVTGMGLGDVHCSRINYRMHHSTKIKIDKLQINTRLHALKEDKM